MKTILSANLTTLAEVEEFFNEVREIMDRCEGDRLSFSEIGRTVRIAGKPKLVLAASRRGHGAVYDIYIHQVPKPNQWSKP